ILLFLLYFERAVTGFVLVWLLPGMVLMMAASTPGMMSYRRARKGPATQLPAFLARLPVSSLELVAAKVRLAAVVAVLPWLVVGPLGVWGLTILGGIEFEDARLERLHEVARDYRTLGALFMLVVGPLLTWKCLLDGLWLGVVGRVWTAMSLAL